MSNLLKNYISHDSTGMRFSLEVYGKTTNEIEKFFFFTVKVGNVDWFSWKDGGRANGSVLRISRFNRSETHLKSMNLMVKKMSDRSKYSTMKLSIVH